MHRYEELEKLYYKKLFFKIFIIALIIILLAFAIFYTINLNANNKKINSNTHKNKKVAIKKNNEINITKTDKNASKPQKITFILPNIDFLKEPKEPKKIIKKKPPQPKKEVKQQSINSINLSAKSVSLNQLISEYKKNKDYNIAITIANAYLERNDLKHAQKWALEANNISPSKPDSWIIFADILARKKQIKKAKSLLKAYIDSYGNNDIIEEKLRSLDGE